MDAFTENSNSSSSKVESLEEKPLALVSSSTPDHGILQEKKSVEVSTPSVNLSDSASSENQMESEKNSKEVKIERNLVPEPMKIDFIDQNCKEGDKPINQGRPVHPIDCEYCQKASPTTGTKRSLEEAPKAFKKVKVGSGRALLKCMTREGNEEHKDGKDVLNKAKNILKASYRNGELTNPCDICKSLHYLICNCGRSNNSEIKEQARNNLAQFRKNLFAQHIPEQFLLPIKTSNGRWPEILNGYEVGISHRKYTDLHSAVSTALSGDLSLVQSLEALTDLKLVENEKYQKKLAKIKDKDDIPENVRKDIFLLKRVLKRDIFLFVVSENPENWKFECVLKGFTAKKGENKKPGVYILWDRVRFQNPSFNPLFPVKNYSDAKIHAKGNGLNLNSSDTLEMNKALPEQYFIHRTIDLQTGAEVSRPLNSFYVEMKPIPGEILVRKQPEVISPFKENGRGDETKCLREVISGSNSPWAVESATSVLLDKKNYSNLRFQPLIPLAKDRPFVTKSKFLKEDNKLSGCDEASIGIEFSEQQNEWKELPRIPSISDVPNELFIHRTIHCETKRAISHPLNVFYVEPQSIPGSTFEKESEPEVTTPLVYHGKLEASYKSGSLLVGCKLCRDRSYPACFCNKKKVNRLIRLTANFKLQKFSKETVTIEELDKDVIPEAFQHLPPFLEKYFRTGIVAVDDNNSLFHAVSVAICGTYRLSRSLQALTRIELMNDIGFLWKQFESRNSNPNHALTGLVPNQMQNFAFILAKLLKMEVHIYVVGPNDHQKYFREVILGNERHIGAKRVVSLLLDMKNYSNPRFQPLIPVRKESSFISEEEFLEEDRRIPETAPPKNVIDKALNVRQGEIPPRLPKIDMSRYETKFEEELGVVWPPTEGPNFHKFILYQLELGAAVKAISSAPPFPSIQTERNENEDKLDWERVFVANRFFNAWENYMETTLLCPNCRNEGSIVCMHGFNMNKEFDKKNYVNVQFWKEMLPRFYAPECLRVLANDPRISAILSEEVQEQLETDLRKIFKAGNVLDDGNGLFCSLSVTLVGDESLADTLRAIATLEYLAKTEKYLRKFRNFSLPPEFDEDGDQLEDTPLYERLQTMGESCGRDAIKVLANALGREILLISTLTGNRCCRELFTPDEEDKEKLNINPICILFKEPELGELVGHFSPLFPISRDVNLRQIKKLQLDQFQEPNLVNNENPANGEVVESSLLRMDNHPDQDEAEGINAIEVNPATSLDGSQLNAGEAEVPEVIPYLSNVLNIEDLEIPSDAITTIFVRRPNREAFNQLTRHAITNNFNLEPFDEMVANSENENEPGTIVEYLSTEGSSTLTHSIMNLGQSQFSLSLIPQEIPARFLPQTSSVEVASPNNHPISVNTPPASTEIPTTETGEVVSEGQSNEESSITGNDLPVQTASSGETQTSSEEEKEESKSKKVTCFKPEWQKALQMLQGKVKTPGPDNV